MQWILPPCPPPIKKVNSDGPTGLKIEGNSHRLSLGTKKHGVSARSISGVSWGQLGSVDQKRKHGRDRREAMRGLGEGVATQMDGKHVCLCLMERMEIKIASRTQYSNAFGVQCL